MRDEEVAARIRSAPPADRGARGRWAEAQARQLMEKNGLRLLEKNYSCKVGELDLIMVDQGILVVAEVRYRKRDDFGTAAESVDGRKQRKVIRTTEHFIGSRPQLKQLPVRFDVVAVSGTGRESKLEWIKDAFQA